MRHFSLAFVIVLVLAGCGESPEMKDERARLELAEMKGDLDSMFLSLRKLAELGDEPAETRLPKLQLAISTRERMFQATADHDHEMALQAAAQPAEPGGLPAARRFREGARAT